MRKLQARWYTNIILLSSQCPDHDDSAPYNYHINSRPADAKSVGGQDNKFIHHVWYTNGDVCDRAVRRVSRWFRPIQVVAMGCV